MPVAIVRQRSHYTERLLYLAFHPFDKLEGVGEITSHLLMPMK